MAKMKNSENEQKKDQCFIITPIGDDNSEIRRHIEGIIDAVIKPALEDQYEIEVAHRYSMLGSITKQIIEAIYNSKLVIANLTNCNPNVMYELALRHAIGKPVIMIAEDGTKLPSDVMMQRTIFYRNDAMGVLKLRDKLRETAAEIDFEKKCGLVFEALGEISHDAAMLEKVAKKDSGSREPLEYIMRRLDRIEALLPAKTEQVASDIDFSTPRSFIIYRIKARYDDCPPEFLLDNKLFNELSSMFLPPVGIRITFAKVFDAEKIISINLNCDSATFIPKKVRHLILNKLTELGFTNIEIIYS